MTRFTRAASLFTGAILLVSACDRVADVTRPFSNVAGTNASLIGTAPRFYFLKPIAARASSSGELDATLSPVVEICAWHANACVLPLVSRLTNVTLRGADGDDDADDAQVEAEPGAHYGVKWKTHGLNLDPAITYRIRVLVAGTELGFADVDVVRNAREARSVDRSSFVPLVAGKNLKIRFRIDKGAVSVIGAAGGRVSAAGGRVQLDVPAGALEADAGITVQEAIGAPLPGGFVLAGSTYDFGPDGLSFDPPAQLTIGYDESQIPAGRDEHELKLLHFVNGVWQAVAGSVVNAQANTVNGPISGFSQYGVGGGPVVKLTGSGTATIDGTVGAAEWSNAGCATFQANLPSGVTTPADVCVMNDATNLYVSVKYAESSVSGDNAAWVDFDVLDDGRSPDDDALLVQSGTSLGTPVPAFFDLFLSCPSPCTNPSSSVHAPDVNDGGASDGSGTFVNAGGISAYEFAHPLNSADNAHDFSVAPGAEMGFNLSLAIGSFATASSYPANDHVHVLISGTVTPPQPVLTGWGTAIVDGVMSPGEWDLAGSVAFTINIPPAGNVPATMYVMNDGTNLYVAVKYDHAVLRDGVRFGLMFDADNDGQDEEGEDRVVGGIESGNQTFQDQYSSAACGFDKCSDAQGGGANHGAQALQFQGTHYILEVSHPLNSGDARDFALQAGALLGMNFGLFIFDEPPNDNGFLTQFPGAGTYVQVLIQEAPLAVVPLRGMGTAALDGVMNALEWRHAGCVFFRVSFPGGGDTPAKYCVMNDGVNLYVGLSYARGIADPQSNIRLWLDKDLNGSLGDGDDYIGYDGPSGGFVDGHRVGPPTCNAFCDVADSPDGAGAFAQSATHVTFELRRPLNLANADDAALTSGLEIGFGFIVSLTNAMAQSAISYLPPGGVTLMKIRIQ